MKIHGEWKIHLSQPFTTNFGNKWWFFETKWENHEFLDEETVFFLQISHRFIQTTFFCQTLSNQSWYFTTMICVKWKIYRISILFTQKCGFYRIYDSTLPTPITYRLSIACKIFILCSITQYLLYSLRKYCASISSFGNTIRTCYSEQANM